MAEINVPAATFADLHRSVAAFSAKSSVLAYGAFLLPSLVSTIARPAQHRKP